LKATARASHTEIRISQFEIRNRNKTKPKKGIHMSEESEVTQAQAPDGAPDDATGGAKFVPVAESIKYRRRAQQAETRLAEVEQQLKDVEGKSKSRDEEIALAEAQRDEAQQHLQAIENRLAVERRLFADGVIDVETAADALAKRIDLGEAIDADEVASAVEQLLLDKPFLRGESAGGLPSPTAAARSNHGAASRLANVAQRAARSGDRRDVAEYLRLRRASARSK